MTCMRFWDFLIYLWLGVFPDPYITNVPVTTTFRKSLFCLGEIDFPVLILYPALSPMLSPCWFYTQQSNALDAAFSLNSFVYSVLSISNIRTVYFFLSTLTFVAALVDWTFLIVLTGSGNNGSSSGLTHRLSGNALVSCFHSPCRKEGSSVDLSFSFPSLQLPLSVPS